MALPTRAAHDFHYERPLVGKRGARDAINSFEYSVQRRVRAYGHIGATEIVVDRADYTDQVQASVHPRSFYIYFTCAWESSVSCIVIARPGNI